MTRQTRASRALVCAAALLAGPAAAPAAAQQSPTLSRGIELYWNGQYERALEVLADDALQTLADGERPEALKYRAFSLVALERNGEARSCFERLLQVDPAHRLDRTVVSPKILAQFGAARAALVAARFEEARTRYDAGEYEESLSGLETVLELDPGHALAAEYRQLARARLDLAEEEAAAVATPAPPAVEPGRIYNVTGAIREPVLEHRIDPDYPRLDRVQGHGGTVVLVLVVDDRGEVREARVVRSVNSRIDAAAQRAVKRWRYRPARLAGAAVSVYKVVSLQFVP